MTSGRGSFGAKATHYGLPLGAILFLALTGKLQRKTVHNLENEEQRNVPFSETFIISGENIICHYSNEGLRFFKIKVASIF